MQEKERGVSKVMLFLKYTYQFEIFSFTVVQRSFFEVSCALCEVHACHRIHLVSIELVLESVCGGHTTTQAADHVK